MQLATLQQNSLKFLKRIFYFLVFIIDFKFCNVTVLLCYSHFDGIDNTLKWESQHVATAESQRDGWVKPIRTKHNCHTGSKGK